MRVAPAKAAKPYTLRLPNSLELGSLRHFSTLQLLVEKNRHPFECGILGTLRQKLGFKSEYIYYKSITYSKAAKVGILSWQPLGLGILSKTPLFPLRLPDRLRLPSSLTLPHQKQDLRTTDEQSRLYVQITRTRSSSPPSVPQRGALRPPTLSNASGRHAP
jgi:hypothetical protein